VEINNVDFSRIKKLDKGLEKLEDRLKNYLLQNEIERSNEVDSELFDIYDDVKELRTSLDSAIDELEERGELTQGLRDRIRERLDNLGLLEKAGAALTIWNLIEKIMKLIGK